MGANILHQALPMIAGSHTQATWKKRLGISSVFVSSRLYVFTAPTCVSISAVSPGSFLCCAKLCTRPSFIVGSEVGSGGETGPSEAAVQEEEEANTKLEDQTEVESETAKEDKSRRKPRVRLGDIMGILNKRAIEASNQQRPTPDLRTGDIIEIKLEVPENRRRLSIYKGIVMSKQNAGIHTTIRVRRIIAGCGVEIVFPVYSPNIKEIKVVKHRKVRRAKLYYLRDKLPRLSTFN